MSKEELSMRKPYGISNLIDFLSSNRLSLKERDVGIRDILRLPDNKLNEFIVVTSGTVQTYYTNIGGREIGTGFFGPKWSMGIIGIDAIYSDKDAIAITGAKVVEDGTRIIKVSSERFKQAIERQPDGNLLLFLLDQTQCAKNAVEESINRANNRRTRNLVGGHVHTDLMNFIDYCVDLGIDMLPFTHEVIACHLGIHRSVATHHIDDMKSTGILEQEGRSKLRILRSPYVEQEHYIAL